MHRLVATAYLVVMLGVSSLLFLLPEAEGDVIATIAAMSVVYSAVDRALRESD